MKNQNIKSLQEILISKNDKSIILKLYKKNNFHERQHIKDKTFKSICKLTF